MDKKPVSTQHLISGFHRGTDYMMSEGVELKADKSVQSVNRPLLEYNVVMGNVMMGDYYILKAIYELGFTTTFSLLSRLLVEKRRNADIEYPFKDYLTLRSRLEFLAGLGLLFCFCYLDRTGTSKYIFCCSNEGWRAFKNRLSCHHKYDTNTIYCNTYEVFRKVCANSVLCSFGESEYCTSIVGAGEITYRDETRDKKAYLYGKATIEDADGRRARYIIEPVHFAVNTKLVSYEENKRRISERLTQLESVVRYYNTRESDPIDTYLVIVVENYEGLRELVSVIKTKNVSFYIDRCYFTNEYVVSRSAEGKVANALLGLSVTPEKKTSFSSRELIVNLEVGE